MALPMMPAGPPPMPMGGMVRTAPPMPPTGGPPGMMGGGPRLGEMLQMMAQVKRKSQPIGTELVEQAIELLDRAREIDSKIAPVATMAITILENGPEGMEKVAGETPR